MKPFNLSEAKAGKPVCTRDGRDVRIVCWDFKYSDTPLLALVAETDGEEMCLCYGIDGRFYNDQDSEEDLFMKEEKSC